jgi:hypothetical protein
VLHAGPRNATETRSTNREACAFAVAEAIRDISDGRIGVTKSELRAAAAELRPDLFGSQINQSTARSNTSRGVKAAIDYSWIVERRGKLFPGEVVPPMAADPLEGLVA